MLLHTPHGLKECRKGNESVFVIPPVERTLLKMGVKFTHLTSLPFAKSKTAKITSVR